MRKSSPSRSSTPAKTTRFRLKYPVRRRKKFQGCREAINLPTSWFCWGVPSGMTSFHFCNTGVKPGVREYQEDLLQGVVKPLNTTLFNGQKWVFQQDSGPAHKAKTNQEWLRRQVPAFISALDKTSGSPDLNTLDYKLWVVLEDMACRKCHNNLDNLKRSLMKVAAEISVETLRALIAKWLSVSSLAWRQSAGILSGIIINKNLKILLINYLARKVDVLFHFPSRPQYNWDRTYGRTVYNIKGILYN